MIEDYRGVGLNPFLTDVLNGLAQMLGVKKSAIPTALETQIREFCATHFPENIRPSALRRFLEGGIKEAGPNPFKGFIKTNDRNARVAVRCSDLLATMLAVDYKIGKKPPGTIRKAAATDQPQMVGADSIPE